MTGAVEVRPVARDELPAVLPLIAGYQSFYGTAPDPARNAAFFARFVAPSDLGELLAAWHDDAAVGFATLYWTHSSVSAVDVVLLNDLFVAAEHRGGGVAQALVAAAARRAQERGSPRLEWVTAPDNHTAQRLYDALGATRSQWLHYELDLPRP